MSIRVNNIRKGNKMYPELDEIKEVLSKHIHYAEDDFYQDTDNHYYLGVRDGLQKALEFVKNVEGELYDEFNKWAKSSIKGKG